MPKHHAAQYNLVAKVLRERYPHFDARQSIRYHLIPRRTIEVIALDFAERFLKDNPAFDPIRFLDACSPDPDRFPFSELWEERKIAQNGS